MFCAAVPAAAIDLATAAERTTVIELVIIKAPVSNQSGSKFS
jgi:hypothetical protein